jgi:hypothetical protein
MVSNYIKCVSLILKIVTKKTGRRKKLILFYKDFRSNCLKNRISFNGRAFYSAKHFKKIEEIRKYIAILHPTHLTDNYSMLY